MTTNLPRLLLLLALTLAAPGRSSSEDLRVAVVEMERMVQFLPEKQRIEKELKEEFETLRKNVGAEWKELEALNERAGEYKKMLSKEGWEAHQEKIVKKEQVLSQKWNEVAERIKTRTEEVAKTFSEQVEGKLKTYAEGNQLDLLFDLNSGRLVYSAERLNQTDQMIRHLFPESISTNAIDEAGEN